MAKRKRSPNQTSVKKKKVSSVKTKPETKPKVKPDDVVPNVLNESEKSLDSLKGILGKVKSVANTAEKVAAGNTVEQNVKRSFPEDNTEDEIKSDGTKINEPGEEAAEEEKLKKKKKKRGRKPKGTRTTSSESSADDDDETEERTTDQIATILNGLAVPFIAKFTGKDAKELMFTAEQQRQSVKLMPEDSFFDRPSWGVYFLNLAGQGMSNWIQAGDDRMKRMENRIAIILSVIDKPGNESLKSEIESKFAEAETTEAK